MTDTQLWVFGAFVAVVLTLSVGMWPTARKLNGAQKYRRFRRPGPDADPDANHRPSMSPLAIALSFFAGSAASNSPDVSAESDGGEADGADTGSDGGGGE